MFQKKFNNFLNILPEVSEELISDSQVLILFLFNSLVLNNIVYFA